MKKNKSAFHDIPHDVRAHFILNLHCAVFHLITHLLRLNELGGDNLEKVFERHPFLTGYFEQMYSHMPEGITWDDALSWWQHELTIWENGAQIHLPLNSLGRQLGIGFRQRLALMCVGIVEEDSRFGTLFAELQEPLPYRRPGLEIIGQVVLVNDAPGHDDPWQLFAPLLAAGLVESVNPEGPRSEWALKVPNILWDVLRGETGPQPAPWADYHALTSFPDLDNLILSPNILSQLKSLPGLLGSDTIRIVLVRGMEGSERLEVMGAVARAMGKNVVNVTRIDPKQKEQWALMGALCATTNSMPVITYDMGPGETAGMLPLGAYKGPIGVILGFEGGVKGTLLEKSVTFRLSPPDILQRSCHWEKVFNGYTIKDIPEISERFHLPGLYINKVGNMAIAYAGLDMAKEVSTRHVRQACRSLNHQMLDSLSSRLESSGDWDDLIVSNETSFQLQELENRCRYREELNNHLGAAFRSQPNWGVRAIFTGPSGTGKTLAAKIIAARLNMEIYRIDLASVINKYIGETEKNLHKIMSKAEELDIILLLDEGDALLGKRSDIKSANDRYANLETNYLLQRLEYYQGIVLITSNAAENIDPAFQRRMDIAIGFLPPEAEERRQIWQLHLPSQHGVHDDLLTDVAQRCAMTGGQIRNAAQQATLSAMEGNHGVIRNWHLRSAIENEYRKAGALSPLNNDPDDKYLGDNLDSFVASLSL